MQYERKVLRQICSGDESVELELVTNMKTGESQLELHKTITQRFETKDLDKAEALADRLMGGGGRRFYSLEDLANERVGK